MSNGLPTAVMNANSSELNKQKSKKNENKDFVIKLAILSIIILFFGGLLYDWLFRTTTSTIGYQGYAFCIALFLFALGQLIRELISFIKRNRNESPPKNL